MAAPWPARSLAECNEILTAVGCAWETEEKVIRGRKLKVYKRQAASLRDFWAGTTQFAPRDYLVYGHERVSYLEAHKRVAQLASFLSHGVDVRKGDRVALCMRNLPDWPLAFWAIQAIGAVVVAVNCFNSPDVIAHCISAGECKVALVDEERMRALAPAVDELRQKGCSNFFVVRTKSVRRGFKSLDEAVDDHSVRVLDPVTIEPEDDASIYFTSGTSGMPKGVLSTQRQFISNLLNAQLAPVRALLRAGQSIPEPDPSLPQRAFLLTVPLFHVMGCQGSMMVFTASGGKLVLMHKWNPAEAASLVVDERVTNIGGVPHQATELIQELYTRGDRHFLEGVSFGGAPAPSNVPQRARKAFPSVSTGQGYGLTETNAVATSFAGEDYFRRPGSCGLPTPVTELKIVDPDTKEELGPGQVGEVAVRGPQICEGYWRNPEATGEVFDAEGWFRSGDVGYLDEEGFLFISDRIKDIIIRGGENIPSTMVEDHLYRNERVAHVAVVGVPDNQMGELVAAVVVAKEGARPHESELLAFAAKALPKHMVPVMVLFKDDLPRNATGKVLKKDLKQELRQEWERRLAGGGVRAKL